MIKIVVLIIVLLALSETARSQSVFVAGRPDSFSRAKDFTKFIETSCVNQVRERVGSNVMLEIRYDHDSTGFVNKISSAVKASVSRALEILEYGGPATLRIYIAKVDRLPASYKIVKPPDVNFIWAIIYDKETDLNADCENITTLCETIYPTLPHELAHLTNQGKFARDATWMDEGLAEYVGRLVSSELSPRQAWRQEMITLPEVSLNAKEIRNNLLSWTYTPETMNEETALFYGAAHQMVRLIIAEAEKNGEKEPLKKILDFFTSQSRPLTSAEVVAYLKGEFKVDVTKLGMLEAKRKNEIFENAKSIYLRERYNPKTGYRYTSLNTFAYLGENLPDEFVVALIEEVLDEKNTQMFRRLSAKALLLRLDQPTFDRMRSSAALRRTKLEKYNSLGAFKKYLSIRSGEN